jgi:hypothetical protein
LKKENGEKRHCDGEEGPGLLTPLELEVSGAGLTCPESGQRGSKNELLEADSAGNK